MLKIFCNDATSLRLFISGSFTIPEIISPPAVFLKPPEKLVLEVSASGGYGHILWNRDSNALGSGAAPATVNEFTNFFEIFVREPTTTSDLGVYTISYNGSGGVGTNTMVIAQGNTCIYAYVLHIYL